MAKQTPFKKMNGVCVLVAQRTAAADTNSNPDTKSTLSVQSKPNTATTIVPIAKVHVDRKSSE